MARNRVGFGLLWVPSHFLLESDLAEQPYQRDKNGIRLDLLGGLNTMQPTDAMEQGYPFLQNLRRNLFGRAVARPALGGNILGSIISPPTSMIRMNDGTSNGPTSGYVLIIGAAGKMYVYDGNNTTVDLGLPTLSGNPLSFVTFRPNTSPQPWCYTADANGMWKVRWNQSIAGPQYRKTGIAEPQAAPAVTTSGGGPNWVMYRYTYRASETGAVSNPSPESAPQTLLQSSVSGVVTGTNLNTKVTYNHAQYEYLVDGGVSEIRTKSIASGTVTDYMVANNFGLSVPSDVNIDGVQVTLNWAGQHAGTGLLGGVALYYSGASIGQAKAPAELNQQFVGSTGSNSIAGGNSDSWGTTLTPAIVNDSTFGFGVQVTALTVGSTNRSFFYSFTVTVYYTSVSTTVSATTSVDPQVDKIDFYRMDAGLDNFTYVGTIPNPAVSSFTDTLSDLAIAANPTLEFDNFEPFPSIDLPHKGTVTVGANGAVTYASGDHFNVRWLPGNIILIAGIAYSLYNRPTSTTALKAVATTVDSTTGYITIGYPPVSIPAVSYEISEPSLAAEPSPVIWGPTPDNAGSFYFGLDPLNPGDLLWSKGNNFDSAPDTNRLFVTSPSEVLMNGIVTSELTTVFSTERFWLIYPNFGDAVATVTGTLGQQWTLIQAAATRGLYVRYALAALGNMIAYRAKDCICISSGGGPEQSITESIYNLFPHEGVAPQPVIIGNQIIYPPDDTNPNAQTITIANGYIYYDYAYLYGVPDVPQTANFVPASVVTEGVGIPWQLPANTTGSGIGSKAPAVLTGFTITSNVVTFTTGPQDDPLVAGQAVTIGNLTLGTYLNGQVLTVLSGGLSTTSFTANFSHVNVATTGDAGVATPATIYTWAFNPGGLIPSPPAGQYITYAVPSPGGTTGVAHGTCVFGTTWLAFNYTVTPYIIQGANGCPFAHEVDAITGNCQIPTLPPGAVVHNIYAMAQGTQRTSSGAFMAFEGHYTGGTNFFILNGTMNIDASLGTDLSIVPTYFFKMRGQATLETLSGYTYSTNIKTAQLAILYTVPAGTPTPLPEQLQTLAATNAGLALPATSPVTGIEIKLNAGSPCAAVLVVQLTLNGTAVGTTKTVNVGAWSSAYTVGGASDLWGLDSLTGDQVNGPALGVNVTGTLPSGCQINLNGLSGTVHYLTLVQTTGYGTLVYDLEAKGWSVDSYSPVVKSHLWSVGVNQLLCGGADGTVRVMGGGGETGTAILATRSENGGDARADKRVGDVFIRALATASNPITLALWRSRFTIPVGGFSPTTLVGSGSGTLVPYVVDFTSGLADDVDDIAAQFSWPLGSGNVLDLWQPDWTELPETVQDRPTDWTDCGFPGNKLIRGMMVQMDTFNASKAITVERSDSETLIAPNQIAVTANGQTLVPFTFTPFTAHLLRIVTTDGVPWRYWDVKWIADPWPDYTPLYSAWMNLGTDGAKYLRSLVIPMDTNGVPATFNVATSDGDTITFTATTPTATKTQVAFAFVPPIVAHEIQIQCLSVAALWSDEGELKWDFDPYPEIIPEYTPIMEIGGPDNKFVQGIKLVGDSANLPVQFQILYDGGQSGPILEARSFNGKQTQVYALNPPLIAHDLQLMPLSSVRIFTEESKWIYEPYVESATIWETAASSFGLMGWIHLYQMNLAYISTQPVVVTVITDQGSFTLTYPAAGAGTMPAKILIKAPRNKWKVCAFTITSSAPFSIWKELCEVWMKPWGSTGEYQKLNPFGVATTPGAAI